MKESKKINNLLNLGRVLKKLWSRRVTVIPILIGALGMFHKRLEIQTW